MQQYWHDSTVKRKKFTVDKALTHKVAIKSPKRNPKQNPKLADLL